MRRFQFSILGLIGLMTFVGIGCAAMVNASAAWCSAVAIFLMLALLNSIVGAICRRGRERVYWIGFLVFGWGSLLLLFENPLVSIRNPQPECLVNNVFISNHLKRLYDVTHTASSNVNTTTWTAPTPPSVVNPNAGVLTVNPPILYPGTTTINAATLTLGAVDSSPEHYFVITGNLLFAMLCALIGGFFARSVYASPAKSENETDKKGATSCSTL
jgi:hypothetical protein